MTGFYLVILGFLILLACFDLFVGVSNDAVNFLTSALGCRIASYRLTMAVASLGVLLGATFSSGMMEVARSGVFQPQMFSFADIMVVFLAVMISDVLLLDSFNSLGLPTSTTVSIVFELLGSALAAAVCKITAAGRPITDLADYINTGKALAIISGILLSVVVAFVVGAVAQYLARLVFTFSFERAYRRVGGLFGGLALTAIAYFLVIKGAAGSSFMRPEWLSWIEGHTPELLLGVFAASSLILQAGLLLARWNVFRLIILSGTFALAFSFAGNDLVNFVGVPLAALDSARDFAAHGVDPDTFMMYSLLRSDATPTVFLFAFGGLMVLTLWLSRKARRVVQTSINLSSSGAGTHEQFGSSLPGRMIVRSSLSLRGLVYGLLPAALLRRLRARFRPRARVRGEIPLPFDYVRASINLVMSAILISLATSFRLPLSTTYVTFMVAMGSSLADGAWDRESAVYRVSGVLTVISGWFLTAFAACTMAGLICSLLMWGGTLMACLLIAAVATLVVRSNLRQRQTAATAPVILSGKADSGSVRRVINDMVGGYLERGIGLFGATVDAFMADDETELRRLTLEATALFDDLSERRADYYGMAREHGAEDCKLDQDARYCYLRAYTAMREVARSLQRLTLLVKEHIANRHRVFVGPPRERLLELAAALRRIGAADSPPRALAERAAALARQIDETQSEMLRNIVRENMSMRGCELYLSFLQFARELINRFAMVAALQRELNENCELAARDGGAGPGT